MYFQAALLFSLAASSLALPTTTSRPVKRAVLSVQQYSQFQVSSGVGGNALAEVKAKFPVRYHQLENSSSAC